MVDPMHHPFAQEKLDCYRLAVEVARWFQQASLPRGRAELRKQGQDAADSLVLNIAEGAGRRQGKGDAGKNVYPSHPRLTTNLHHDGSQWASRHSGTEQPLAAVFGRGPGQVFVVGNNGTVLQRVP